MRPLLVLFSLLFSTMLLAQTSPCGQFRFLQVIFSDTEMTAGVQYGQNTTIGGNSQDLLMDVYNAQGDTLSRRIPIILASNGAFSGRDRADLRSLAENLATRGYIVFAIDVRPFDISLDGSTTEGQMLDWLYGAATDVKAAVRFLRQEWDNGNPYGINPNIIFVGGVGAGALAATHAAMVGPNDNVDAAFQAAVDANGGWEGNSNNITAYSSDVRGVVSYSGGLVNAEWLDTDDPLFLAYHDNRDDEVPFETGTFAPGGVDSPLSVDGSLTLTDRAEALFIYHDIIASNSSSHVSYLASANGVNNTANSTSAFIHEVNCSNIVSSLFDGQVVDREVSLFPNPARDLLSVRVGESQDVAAVRILDAVGREIRRWENRTVIDVSTLDRGFYLLQVEFSDARVSRAVKWMKQ